MGQARVEVDAVGALDVRADEGRVGHHHAAIVDVGQLAPWRLRRNRGSPLVGHPSHLQLDLGLEHERAGIGQAEAGAGGVEGQA
jgi:hypothetical protein